MKRVNFSDARIHAGFLLRPLGHDMYILEGGNAVVPSLTFWIWFRRIYLAIERFAKSPKVWTMIETVRLEPIAFYIDASELRIHLASSCGHSHPELTPTCCCEHAERNASRSPAVWCLRSKCHDINATCKFAEAASPVWHIKAHAKMHDKMTNNTHKKMHDSAWILHDQEAEKDP